MTASSLTQSPGYKVAAGATHHAPTTPFVPESIDLDHFGLVPWVRAGLSAGVSGIDATGRATIDVAITLSADSGATLDVPQKLSLYGPADVIGIDPRQIVRREPPPGAPVGDASTLAHIEFDRPELPWLYTPEAAIGNRLRPWIALVVVDATLAKLSPASGDAPARLTVPVTELPPLDDSWAWAHAQVHGTLTGVSLGDRLTDAYAAQNLSRLICPRRLEDNRSYIACVVPTFESGRRAGLGLADGGGLTAAWSGNTGDVMLPVYDHWSFVTTASANFEMLARKLQAVPAPHEVGRRIVDTSTPGGRMVDVPLATAGAVQAIECALHSPAPAKPAPVEWTAARTAELAKTINDLADTDVDLPRVGPRVYARFQRGAATVPPVDPNDWFSTINLRPVHRIAAGLGTRVVARDQEKLIEAAWAQVGEVDKANRELNRLQFGRYIAEAMIAKTLAKLDLGPLAQVAHPVFGKLPLEDGRTVAAAIRTSATPWAATTSAFRGLTAANSKLSRTASLLDVSVNQAASPFTGVLATQAGLKDMRRSFAEPDAVAGLSQGAIESLPVGGLARVLNVAPGVAVATAKQRFGSFTSAATRLTAPRASWTVKSGSFDGALADAELDRGGALQRDIAKLSPGRREALGGYLAVLAEAAPAATAARIDARLIELAPVEAAGPVIRPRPVPGPIGRTPPTRGPVVVPQRADPVQTRQRFLKFGNRTTPLPPRAATSTYASLADQLSKTIGDFATGRLPKTPALPVAAQVTKQSLLAPLAPGLVATKIIKARLGAAIGTLVPSNWFDNQQAGQIMAAPHFDRPMYEALEDYDKEWLIANLGNVKQTDFVTLLVSNAQFIEAFMVGLSDEMGRELLWRGYPTDQRGTYFRRFWSPSTDELKPDIAFFPAGGLGSHMAGGAAGQVVMLVKGDLIRRYPNAMFMAAEGRFLPDKTEFEDPPVPGARGSVSFMARLAEDTLIVGLNLTLAEVAAAGPNNRAWWFLIAEHPSAPRFGLDVKPAGSAPDTPTKIDDLDWQDLPMTAGRFLKANAPGPTLSDGVRPFTWGSDAAAVARMLLQNPARAAFNAKALTDHAQ